MAAKIPAKAPRLMTPQEAAEYRDAMEVIHLRDRVEALESQVAVLWEWLDKLRSKDRGAE